MTFRDLNFEQRGKIAWHPDMLGIGAAGGLLIGVVMVGGIVGGAELVFTLTERLGGVPLGPIWWVFTGVQFALIVLAMAIGLKFLKAREAALIAEFLECESDSAERSHR